MRGELTFICFVFCANCCCFECSVIIACELDLDLRQFDIGKTFLQSNLEENAFRRLAQGCGMVLGKIVRLNKCFYT